MSNQNNDHVELTSNNKSDSDLKQKKPILQKNYIEIPIKKSLEVFAQV